MIKLGRLLFIAIMTCMIASSCSDDDIDVKITPINVPQVPLNIEDTKKEELFLVDNEAELNQVFAGHTKELPQIDFKNFKLLLIHGSHIKQVKDITLDSFTKVDKGCYDMLVSIKTDDKDAKCYWTAAYLVPQDFKTPICLFLSIDNKYQLPQGKWFYFK